MIELTPWGGSSSTVGLNEKYVNDSSNGFQAGNPVYAKNTNAAIRASSLVTTYIWNKFLTNETIDSSFPDVTSVLDNSVLNTAFISVNGNNVVIGSGKTLSVTGNATVGGTLSVTGNATVGGTLGVTGNATVGGTLGVTGTLSTDTISPKTGSSVAIANDSGQNLSTTKLNTNSIQGISGADLTLIPASSQKISLSGNTEVAGTFETSGLLSANNGLTVKGNSLYLNDGTSNKITLNTNGTATFGGLITATSGISTNTIQPYSGNAIQIAKQANQYISTNKLNTTLVGGSNLTLQETTGNNSISLTTNGILLTGDVTVGGTLNATGNFAINTNKFFVDSTDGDVIVGGTLDVGNIKSNTITIEEQTSTGTKNKLAVSSDGIVIDGELTINDNFANTALKIQRVSALNNYFYRLYSNSGLILKCSDNASDKLIIDFDKLFSDFYGISLEQRLSDLGFKQATTTGNYFDNVYDSGSIYKLSTQPISLYYGTWQLKSIRKLGNFVVANIKLNNVNVAYYSQLGNRSTTLFTLKHDSNFRPFVPIGTEPITYVDNVYEGFASQSSAYKFHLIFEGSRAVSEAQPIYSMKIQLDGTYNYSEKISGDFQIVWSNNSSHLPI